MKQPWRLLAILGLVLAATPLAQASPTLYLPDATLEIAGARPLAPKGKITGYAFGPGRQGIAYCLHPDALPGLYFHTAAGEGPYLIWGAPQGTKLAGPVRWSPDGLRIAFRQVNPDGSFDLLVAEYQGGKVQTLLTRSRVTDCLWSPDGKWVACLSAGKPYPSLGVVAAGGGAMTPLTGAAVDVRWSPSGSSLSWLEPGKTALAARRREFAAETALPRREQPLRPANAVWSPDGLLCAAVLTYGQAPQIFEGEAATSRAIPGVKAARLFGWSPDSQILLGQEVGGRLFAASAHPPARGSGVVVWPILPDLSAGAPSWSSDGRKLAVVLRPAKPYTAGGLYLFNLERRTTGSRPP